MKYLPLYHEWMKTGALPSYGLCSIFGEDLKLFEPTLEYSLSIYSWVESVSDWYWAYSGDASYNTKDIRATAFSPMRQNIVLFLAAMNGEL